MINTIVKVIIEVLCILAIATREIKENCASELILAKKYVPPAQHCSETYLVGKTNIEDALLRLENAILEETQMAATEALKSIHVLQGIIEDRMSNTEGMLEGVGDMLQSFDERTKDITQKGINSVHITVQLVIFNIHNVFMVRC